MSRSELRRAAGYAREAVEEHRRWDGPSIEALTLLLDIFIPDEIEAAVQAALPISEGGTPLDREASSSEVARRGAVAALAIGNEAAYRFVMKRVPDGPRRRELLALEADATGQYRSGSPNGRRCSTMLWTIRWRPGISPPSQVRCVASAS